MRPQKSVLEIETADRAAATAQSAALVPLGEVISPRHLGGCLLAQDRSSFEKEGCLYETFSVACGVLKCPLFYVPVSSVGCLCHGTAWKSIPLYGNKWELDEMHTDDHSRYTKILAQIVTQGVRPPICSVKSSD